MFLKLIPFILFISILCLDYFRQRDYSKKIPLLVNLIFYIFISIHLGIYIYYFSIDLLSVNQLNVYVLLNQVGKLASICMYTYFCILVWYDMSDDFLVKNKTVLYSFKLLFLIIISIILYKVDLIYSFT